MVFSEVGLDGFAFCFAQRGGEESRGSGHFSCSLPFFLKKKKVDKSLHIQGWPDSLPEDMDARLRTARITHKLSDFGFACSLLSYLRVNC